MTDLQVERDRFALERDALDRLRREAVARCADAQARLRAATDFEEHRQWFAAAQEASAALTRLAATHGWDALRLSGCTRRGWSGYQFPNGNSRLPLYNLVIML